MLASIYYVTIALAYSGYVDGARVLGLFPHAGRSHQMVYEPLLRRLAEEGHHVTVASFFPLRNPPANYTDISFEGLAVRGLESVSLVWYESFGVMNKIPVIGRIAQQISEFNVLSAMALNNCKAIMNLPALTNALNKEYDIVFVENFNSDCMLGLLHVHGVKAPLIGLSSCALMAWTAHRIGVNDNPSYVPVMTVPFTSRMSFLERVENTAWKIYFRLWFRHSIQLKEQVLIEKHYGRKIADLADLGRNISLLLVNTHHVLNGATPLAPGLVEVGGMHLDETRQAIPQVRLAALNVAI